MDINLSGFINKNSLNTSDCQLVTAINAYYHLTGNIIKQESEQYKKLIDLCGCAYGSCIDIKKAWNELSIWEDCRFNNLWDIENNLKINCFIEINIWHKHYGFHSSAIVDYNKKTDCVMVTNLKYVTSTKGWIFWEDLKTFIVTNPDKSEPIYYGRTFKIKN